MNIILACLIGSVAGLIIAVWAIMRRLRQIELMVSIYLNRAEDRGYARGWQAGKGDDGMLHKVSPQP